MGGHVPPEVGRMVAEGLRKSLSSVASRSDLSQPPAPTISEEAVARKLARLHFDRREWRGACTKAERTAWLVDRYWPQWRGDAAEMIGLLARRAQ